MSSKRIDKSRAEPSRAESSRAEPSRAEPISKAQTLKIIGTFARKRIYNGCSVRIKIPSLGIIRIGYAQVAFGLKLCLTSVRTW